MNQFRIVLTPLIPLIELPSTAHLAAKVERLLSSNWTLLICKLIIGVVSAYDIHQTVKYVEFLPQQELNPVGRWLMSLDSGPTCELKQTACFITAKFSGNFVALAIIEFLGNWRRHVAAGVAIAIAALQLLLFYFLCFVD